jgi:hypothetical protein
MYKTGPFGLFIYTLAKTLNDLYPVGKPSLENSANDQHFFFVTQQIPYPLPSSPYFRVQGGKLSLNNRNLELEGIGTLLNMKKDFLLE